MKKLTYVIIALTLITSISVISCDKITDLLELTLYNVTFDIDVDVAELTTKDGSYEFGGTATFDPSNNPDLEPYLATIREVEIKEIRVTVDTIVPITGIDLIDASFSITDLVNNANFTYTITETTPLFVGKEFVIDETTPNFNVVSDIINDRHSATVSLEGHVNQTGFVLGFTYSIVADITVGVPQDDE